MQIKDKPFLFLFTLVFFNLWLLEIWKASFMNAGLLISALSSLILG